MNGGALWLRQARGLYLRPGTSVQRRPRRPVVWGLGRYGAVLPGLGLPVMTDGGPYAVPSMRLPAMYPGGSPGGPIVMQLPAGPAPGFSPHPFWWCDDPKTAANLALPCPAGTAANPAPPPPPVVPVAAVPTLPAPVAAPVTSAPIPLWVWVAGGAAVFLFLRGGSGGGHRGR